MSEDAIEWLCRRLSPAGALALRRLMDAYDRLVEVSRLHAGDEIDGDELLRRVDDGLAVVAACEAQVQAELDEQVRAVLRLGRGAG